ncbi:MAG: aminoacyl-tRNA hydrolase [Lentisphaeria bacterium]
MPQLIVGLGNPGPKYESTRHNAGFMTIDRIIELAGPAVKRDERYECKLAEIRLGGRQITLAKPQTLMNLSGRAVGRLQRVLELNPDELLIIYDCLDLPLGSLRLRKGGGSGGHKGMESIIQAVGTSKVPRLRIGIDPSGSQQGVVQHVLSKWTQDELPLVQETISAAAEAAVTALRRGMSGAMNAFNSWTPETETNTE